MIPKGGGDLKEKNHNASHCFHFASGLQKQAFDATDKVKTTPPAARWFFSFVGNY